jgi:DNA replication and repair protein RecF
LTAENPSPGVLTQIRADNFRCFRSVRVEVDRRLSVFTGSNGAGKTSLLEAIYFLGRGRSFRSHDGEALIRAGADSAEISGLLTGAIAPTRLGVRISRTATDFRLNGTAGSASELVALFPVQALHTEIGHVIQGAPDVRRRLLDWGVFHVEHDYLVDWRHYRRALSQRNAALRAGSSAGIVRAWDSEVAAAGERVNSHRQTYLNVLAPEFRRFGSELLEMPVGFEFRTGWNASNTLAQALDGQLEGDRAAGYTRSGPHRADLQFSIEDARSRWRASKGQQKLLAAAFILAQSSLVAAHLDRAVALVVDEPSADLDGQHLARYLRAIESCRVQVFMASITAKELPLSAPHTLFHVEHDGAKALL